MLFKLHYFFLAAGANALFILLGVYMAEYTDASPAELGLLYMAMPFVGLASRPIICSYADRKQAHRNVLIWCELTIALAFTPYVIVPYLGPDVYRAHSRSCWYFLVAFNIVGDIAFGGVVSIGDSLAMNYAKRIGTEFGAYRMWGTISWIIFGFTTGQLNEVWFLPKYVAAFMVLVLVALLDALVCILWPREYFVMVTANMLREEQEKHLKHLKQSGRKENWLKSQTKSLMPKEVVWAHAKKQLWSLLTFEFCLRTKVDQSRHGATSDINEKIRNKTSTGVTAKRPQEHENQSISKRAQLQTLLVLVRRDPRVILYLIMFIGAGAALMPVSFFFMSLSERCKTQHNCNFSQLAGYLQIAMACVEPVLFLYIKTIIRTLGRLNTLSLAFGFGFAKFLFYATIWPDVDPHWSLVSELIDGVLFVTFLTVQVEIGHLFATEVEHLVPELMKRGVIDTDDEATRDRLKLSLPATMLALISGAYDGLGKGLAALAYGLIIEAYSYETLWVVVSTGAFCMVASLQMAAMLERCCQLELGLEHSADSKLQEIDLRLESASTKLANIEDQPENNQC